MTFKAVVLVQVVDGERRVDLTPRLTQPRRSSPVVAMGSQCSVIPILSAGLISVLTMVQDLVVLKRIALAELATWALAN